MITFLKKQSLTFYIAASTILGILAGWLMGPSAAALNPLGDLFMNLIKMVIVPLVFLSITLGAASLDDVKKAGRIGLQAFSFYMTTTVFAILIAIFFGSILQPGVGLDKEQIAKMLPAAQKTVATANVKQPTFVESMLAIIPKNPLQSMTTANMLQIIFFAVFLGICLATLDAELKAPVIKFMNGLNEGFIIMVNAIMWTAPIGVFGLMAVTVGVHGMTTILLLLKLLLVYLLCVVVHFFFVYAGALRLFTKLSPLEYLKRMERPLLVSFTTASSLVTLPTSMETAEDEFGVSKEVASFVLPLGATINMDGSAINFGLYAVFGLQYYGLPITPEIILAIVLTATLGSIGTAGVPGPSVLTISVLNAAGVPLAILPLYIATDRIFDMIRTSINISGDITCSALVNHWNPHLHDSEESIVDEKEAKIVESQM